MLFHCVLRLVSLANDLLLDANSGKRILSSALPGLVAERRGLGHRERETRAKGERRGMWPVVSVSGTGPVDRVQGSCLLIRPDHVVVSLQQAQDISGYTGYRKGWSDHRPRPVLDSHITLGSLHSPPPLIYRTDTNSPFSSPSPYIQPPFYPFPLHHKPKSKRHHIHHHPRNQAMPDNQKEKSP